MRIPSLPFGLRHVAVLASAALLAACGGGGGSSSAPPTNVAGVGQGSRVTLTWEAPSDVNVWIFLAADSRLTTDNWAGLLDGRVITQAKSPNVVCGLTNGRPYYFSLNGRTGAAGGGPGSAPISVTPRAAGASWSLGSAIGGTTPASLRSVGYVAYTSCQSNQAPTGLFVAVGDGGAIRSSSDGVAWTSRAAPAGFGADLLAVAGAATQLNVLNDPRPRIVAVGTNGAILQSSAADAAAWVIPVAPDPARATLRGVAALASGFVAVGDRGTVLVSTDGSTWSAALSNVTTDLHAVTFAANRYMAVGDAGRVISSIDNGNNWTASTVAGVGNLRAVAYGSYDLNAENTTGNVSINTLVAVGDAGVAAVSTDLGTTWTTVNVSGGVPLVALAYTTHFVALAADGRVYTSRLGTTWSGPVATGAASGRALTSDGFGFLGIGAAGANFLSR